MGKFGKVSLLSFSLFLLFPVFSAFLSSFLTWGNKEAQAGSPRPPPLPQHPNGGTRNKIRQKSQIFALFFIFNLLHPVKRSIVTKATLGGPSVHCLKGGRPS